MKYKDIFTRNCRRNSSRRNVYPILGGVGILRVTMQFPHDPIATALTAEGVTEMCTRALAQAQSFADIIRAQSKEDRLSWEATFGVFDQIFGAVEEAVCVPQLMSVAHPDAAVRAAAMTCEPMADAFLSALYLDDDIAVALRRYAAQGEALPRHKEKFAEEVLREYRRNGLSLPPEQRTTLRALNERITQLAQQFDATLAETALTLEVTPEQLRGLPPSFLANHPPQANGMVRLTTDYPDLVPVLRYAEDRTVARALYVLSENRGHETNLPVLRELLQARQKKATLLGYATWAEYVLETRMAGSVQAVTSFIAQLHQGLKPRREAETEELRALQRRVLPEAGEEIAVYNVRFLEDKLRQERFALDSQHLAEYFEGRSVQQGIMAIASQLYGITFQSVTSPTWHDDVEVFDLLQGDAVIGRAYLDLYPREGKYKHAAMFGLRDTCRLPDGARQLPIAALVCNFPKPGASPALMSHEDVVTFFHEFGHLLHHLLSESELVSFAGTNVARDFVEVPSQLFEEWAWDRATLAMFARHHATGEPLPEELFVAMTEARRFGQAIATERQLFLASYDLACHTREPGFDAEELVREMYVEYSSFTRVPETHFPATFGHLTGYCAAYYSYQWALAIAVDVLTRFTAEGMLNRATAADYRAKILAQGASDDAATLVTSFLGRAPGTDAYLRYLEGATSPHKVA